MSRLLFVISILVIIALVALFYAHLLPFDNYITASIMLFFALVASYNLCGIIDKQQDKD